MKSRKRLPGFKSLLTAYIIINLFHCGKTPSEPSRIAYGSLEIRAHITKVLGKFSTAAMTSFDSIVVKIYDAGLDTIRFKKKMTGGSIAFIDTISGIPAGNNRKVDIFTIDKNGNKIHVDSLKDRTARIDQNAVTVINARLIPAAGSLYLQLANVPSNIDSISFLFESTDGAKWEKRVKREFKVNISLDNIPHGTHGMVYLTADSAGTVKYRASKELTFNATGSSELKLDFHIVPDTSKDTPDDPVETASGSLAMNLFLQNHGVTYISINMGNPLANTESGSLVVTEIMYDAPDTLQYIKIYNPSNVALHLDPLIIDVDKYRKKQIPVTVGAHGSCVLEGSLDLTKTGSLVTLKAKDSTIIDQVIYIGSSVSTNNRLEWPSGGANKAIFLDPACYDAIKNNFGRNWTAAP